MRKLLVVMTMASVLLFGLVGVASAGQPGASCDGLSAPGGGNSSQSPGSPFAAAHGVSAGVYANPGTTPGGGPNVPRHVRAALGFLASGAFPFERLITHRVGLDGVAGLLSDPPRDYLKAAVIP